MRTYFPVKLVFTLSVLFFLTACKPYHVHLEGFVYSKHHFAVPNVQLTFTYMIGSKETNTELVSTISDANGHYVLDDDGPKRSSLHYLTIRSDSGTYSGKPVTNGNKSDIQLR